MPRRDNEPVLCLLVLADKKLSKVTELFEADGDVRFMAYRGGELPAHEFVVVQKAGYDLVTANTDSAAAARYKLLQELPPRALLLEPLARSLPLANRAETCKMLAALAPLVQQPRFALLNGGQASARDAAAGLTFPLLCKPFVACGPLGHRLALVLRAEGLDELFAMMRDDKGSSCSSHGVRLDACQTSTQLPQPLLAQEFVDHGGMVLKGYAVGEYTHIAVRPSLPDLGCLLPSAPSQAGEANQVNADGASSRSAGPAVVLLDSQRLPSTDALCDAVLGRSGFESRAPMTTAATEGVDAVAAATLLQLHRRAAETTLRAVRSHLGLDILGVDMVVAPDGGLLVVDTNHFSGAPGSVPGFVDALARSVCERVAEHRRELQDDE